MDYLKEASSESKVLTARHISYDKQVPLNNDGINNSTLTCYDYSIGPDFMTYLTALQTYAWPIWGCCLVLVLAICVLYIITLRSARSQWRDSFSSLAVVLAVYPVVATSALITIVVPRARVLCEAMAQQIVMVAMYHLFSLFIAECGGIKELIRRAEGIQLQTRVPPCCCWPCCFIPRPPIQTRNMTWVRYLILQMSFVQALIYIVFLILRAEDIMLYNHTMVYFQVFIAASILSGVWAMIMCVRAVQDVGITARPRFLALQLALIIVKLQCGIAKVVSDQFALPCALDLHPSVFVNMVQSIIMIGEMLLLSLWACKLYRSYPGKTVPRVQNVVIAVLDDNPNAMDLKLSKEGIDNRSYNNNKVDACNNLNT